MNPPYQDARIMTRDRMPAAIILLSIGAAAMAAIV
jgi:hypothetical protein